jgi:ribosomal protein S12 methylthiotransferase accessory factor
MEVKTKENWCEDSEVGTASLRLTFDGIDEGTNGKGIDRDYALASAYGEFMERYQNQAFDFQYLSEKECADSVNGIKKTFDDVVDQDKSVFEPIVKVIREGLDCVNNDSCICHSFYSVKKQKMVFVPELYLSMFGTNGMSGGNSFEEALVQALAEVIERYVLKKIYIEKPSLPDIPDSYIEKMPSVCKMIKKLRENEDYNVVLKDASFGGKYPVACLLIVEKNTGRYGIKLGCHPNYTIAIERSITEAAQNEKIFDYVNRSIFSFDDNNNLWNNYLHGFRTGEGSYPYETVLFKSDNFVPYEDVTGLSNADLAKKMIEFIVKEEGKDVMIRDVSYTDYYSCHVIVPNYSEVGIFDELNLKKGFASGYAARLASNLNEIDNDGIKKFIIGVRCINSGKTVEEQVIPKYARRHYPFNRKGTCTAEVYALALGYISLNEYENALGYYKALINCDYWSEKQYERLFAEKTYCEGMIRFGNHLKTIDNIQILLSPKWIEHLKTLFKDQYGIFKRAYPSIVPKMDNEQILSEKYDAAMRKIILSSANRVEKFEEWCSINL